MFLIIYYYTGDKLEKHILHTSLLDSKGPRNAHSSTMSSHLTKEKYNMSFLRTDHRGHRIEVSVDTVETAFLLMATRGLFNQLF